MVMEDGLRVHDGRPEAGADWERVIEDGREARIESVCGRVDLIDQE